MIYRSQGGENLGHLAERFSFKIEDLILINPQIKDHESLKRGEKVYLPLYQIGESVEIPIPFPPVRVQEKKPASARLLLDDYAGQVSELTAITLYLYQYFDMKNPHPEVAQLMEDVALVEMEHMEILAELIVLLGGDPRYHNSQSRNWTPEYIMYLTGKPCQQLQVAIEAEEKAVQNYRKRLKQINDPFIQDILRRIIMDELHHINLFSEARRLLGC